MEFIQKGLFSTMVAFKTALKETNEESYRERWGYRRDGFRKDIDLSWHSSDQMFVC